ncbi:5937_t:CDS:2 [Paraglomus occultum]|uniref:5937_t:CDS:1 n=1 Tax=Paraglomus occultum TaxID=144539 RepID=A0A9N9FS78_9GLOM|nr:5937_t:CDS:2 [Paraglomus occultum]
MVVWQPNNSMLTEDPSTTTNTVDMEDENTLKDSNSESLNTNLFKTTAAERKKTAEKLFGNSSTDSSLAVEEDSLDCNINTLDTITDKAKADIKDITNNNSTAVVSAETVGTQHLTDTVSKDSQASLIEIHIPEEHRLSKESRFSKESGMVSSASSINDGDNETDAQQPSSLSQLSATSNDQYARTFSDNSNNHLGMITEEEETKSVLSNHSRNVSNNALESIDNDSEKQNITANVREEPFLASDQADTETRLSSSSQTASFSDVSETPSSSNQTPVEAKRRSSSKRKNSSRSILSVLSPSIRSSSSSSSTRGSSRGSVSDSEGDPVPRKQQQHSVLSKADRILGRSPFGSISGRRRTSRMIKNASESEVTPPGSPNSPEKLSKIGKILGLTPSEEKLLLEKPDAASRIFQLSSSSSSSLDETSANPRKSETDNRPVNNTSNKTIKVLGPPVDNGMPIIDEKSKAGRILGLEEKVQKRRGTSMYVSKVSDRVSGLVVHSRAGISSPITVATVNKNIALTGTLTKYQHAKFGKNWKRRFFILAKTTLYCFKDSERSSLMTDSFEITAETIVCVTDTFSGKPWMLQVNKEGIKPWYLQADNVEDMKLWLAELKATVVKCKYSVTQLPDVPKYKTIDEPVNNAYNTIVPPPRRTRQTPTTASFPQGTTSTVSSSYVQQSLPPPPRPAPSVPANITSLPPPPRSKSAPTTPCPPSPTSSLPPSRPLSPQHDLDVAELAGANIGVPARPSSPVHTLSPPKTRTVKIMVPANHNDIPQDDVDSAITTPTNSYTSLPPPPRSPPPPRTATRSPIQSTPQPPRASRSSNPPRSAPVVYAFNQQYYNVQQQQIYHSTPPSTPPRSPVAVSPPRSTVNVSHVATKRRVPPNLSLSNSANPSPPSPRSPHSTHSAPSSPYYYTTRSRKATDSPPLYKTSPSTPPPRIMTHIPTSLSSALAPTVPHPPGPPRFSKPTSSQSRSMQSSKKSQYQSIPIILPSSAITSIPPPPRTRPPNIPLPSIPTNVKPRNMNGKNTGGVEPAVEFSDDDELDPDYRDEVNAAWKKSQLVKSLEEKHSKRHRNAARVSKRHRDINNGTDDTHRVDSDIESNESDVNTNQASALNYNVRRILHVNERMSSGDFELVASLQELDKVHPAHNGSDDGSGDDDGYAVQSVDEDKMDEVDSMDIYLNGVVDVKTKIGGYESDGSLIDPMDSVDDSTRWASQIF